MDGIFIFFVILICEVGNEVQADVRGGKNMGWTSVLIRSTESTSGGLADYEVDSFAELEQLFFARN
jgi:FMN phosphatase YigB (HAD superfamily)